ncbi:MAG: hypothetical protein IJA07_08260 [Agathobacter sp.]|nr:hypothetical protein [Agathobacter sp.]
MEKKYYGTVLLIALVFGFLFELHLILLLVVVVVYLLCVPKLVRNQAQFRYETNRFHDVNLYMSQMAQSFIYTKDVIQSLEETATSFSDGLMRETLDEGFEILEAGKWNIKRAEMEALLHIESRYDCEKLRNLHAFFLNAEELGGECQKEFKILESMRTAWQGVVESIRIKRVWERNVGAVIYAFFLLVCVIMLHIMRSSDLEIVTLPATQIISTALLIGFCIYYVFMDKRLAQSLLVKSEEMSLEQAEAYFDYFENYDAKKERKKYRSFAILSVVASALFFYIKPSWITLAISVCLIFAGFHVHTFIYWSSIHTMRSEISKAFPKWLFDVMLLLQRESVEGAIEKSIETAPVVLKGELVRMSEMLLMKPHDPEAYMSFLRDFNNQQIREIMHKLYSLAVGANRDAEVMDVVIEKNIKNLEKVERDSMMLRDSMKSFTWIPFLCAGFGCMGYLVIAIVTSINGIVDLIGR